jgi:hypothetical protein
MAKSLNVKQWAKHRERLAGAYWPAVLRGLANGGLRAVAMMNAESHRKAFDRGSYARSWRSRIDKSSLEVYSVSPYAGVIEKGRRPGRRPPPTKALIPWVRRKLRVGRDEAKGVAFVVARAIGRRGIKGKYVLAGMEDRLAREIEREVMFEVEKVLAGA